MKKINIKLILLAISLVFTCVNIKPTIVYATETTEITEETTETTEDNSNGSDGSWCTVTCVQGQLGYPKGCTGCSVMLVMQNSLTLSEEHQLKGNYNSENATDFQNFKKLLDDTAPSNMFSSGAGLVNPAYMFGDVNTELFQGSWSEPSSVNINGTEQTTITAQTFSAVMTEFNGTMIKDLSFEEHLQLCQLLWNNDYWVILGMSYQAESPSGVCDAGEVGSNHWVMMSGVTDTDMYMNDPANGNHSLSYTTKYNNNSSSYANHYEIHYLVLLKNSINSPKDLAGGQIAGNTDGSNDLGVDPLVFKGFYPEADLSAYCKLTEANIVEMYLDDAQIQNLTGDELEAIDNWKTNAGIEDTDTKIVKFIRKIVQLFGIILTVWALLFYLSFWFDRLNNFFDFSLVEVLSFKKLRTSDTDEECTYRASDLGKTNQRTVNHRAVLSISLIAIAFGVLLITGLIYNLISGIVLKAIKFFG